MISDENKEKHATVKQPVMQFKDQEQLNLYVSEWAARLGLSDYLISAKLADVVCDENGEATDDMGYCINYFVNRVADIQILGTNPKGNLEKPCAEKVLVHELLHIILNTVEHTGKDAPIEAVMYHAREHANIERMAKALISAKYGLPLRWFLVD
jgi:hypothetical protein